MLYIKKSVFMKNKKNKSYSKRSAQKNKRRSVIKGQRNKDSVEFLKAVVKKSGKRGVSANELFEICRVSKSEKGKLFKKLESLCRSGDISEYRRRWYAPENLGGERAVVVSLNKTFGFVKKASDESELFVAGKYLMGAMPGDEVLIKEYSSSKGAEARILAVVKQSDEAFSGVVIKENSEKCILPDKICGFAIKLDKKSLGYKAGDKVVAKIASRGHSHKEHIARVIAGFGTASRASACADAYLKANGITEEFPDGCVKQARAIQNAGTTQGDRENRADFTDKRIFTIDSSESKDLDDAVSIEKSGEDYILGVHIADVSHYVKENSPLDREAFERGTSIYFADRVIPMLPKELSNGICSLNPNEERLAFSAVITLDKNAQITDFKFVKSIIKSRVKGVYSEINSILAHDEKEEIKQKYSELYDDIFLMDELTDKLIKNRRKRGAPDIETTESRIITENGVAVDVVPRKRGKSEMIIEEFMLAANNCAAVFARKNSLPFVNRVHEDPPEDKIESLKVILRAMGIQVNALKDGKNPKELSNILKSCADMPAFPAVNRLIVRSMAKAKYSSEISGHYGLALDDYAHFTSPIRRYPDLAIHRIMSEFLTLKNSEKIGKKYSGFAALSANQSTNAEIRAVKLERDCEDCYKAEYMQKFIGDEFSATVSSATLFGFFAELDNSVEGLVSISSLGDSGFQYDGAVSLINSTGRKIAVGDRVRVKCVKADVNSGRIDFEPVEL